MDNFCTSAGICPSASVSGHSLISSGSNNQLRFDFGRGDSPFFFLGSLVASHPCRIINLLLPPPNPSQTTPPVLVYFSLRVSVWGVFATSPSGVNIPFGEPESKAKLLTFLFSLGLFEVKAQGQPLDTDLG